MFAFDSDANFSIREHKLLAGKLQSRCQQRLDATTGEREVLFSTQDQLVFHSPRLVCGNGERKTVNGVW